jgi:hypothetical protein
MVACVVQRLALASALVLASALEPPLLHFLPLLVL